MTKQRRIILDVIKDSPGHLSADEVYISAKALMSSIGLGTVYRNLGMLCQDNVIRKIEISGGPDRYDKNVAPHEHMRCVRCGRLVDCNADMSGLIDKLRADGLCVLGYDLQIIGICENCLVCESENEKECANG